MLNLLTDLRVTFKLKGEASLSFLSADVHQSWFDLAASLSWSHVQGRYQKRIIILSENFKVAEECCILCLNNTKCINKEFFCSPDSPFWHEVQACKPYFISTTGRFHCVITRKTSVEVRLIFQISYEKLRANFVLAIYESSRIWPKLKLTSWES